MNVVLMGRKQGAAHAIQALLDRGHRINAVVPSEPDGAVTVPVIALARAHQIPVRTHEEIHSVAADPRCRAAFGDVDLVISYLHNRRIRPALIHLPRLGCFNFHPAPLPELRGVGGYNFAILDRMRAYGATVHWVSPRIDEGDIVRVKRFAIDPEIETALSLESKAQAVLLELFAEFLDVVESGEPIPAIPQGAGRYIDRRQMQDAMRVDSGDPPELVDRKARAFWFPPFPGAFVQFGERRFTIVPDCVLHELGRPGGATAAGVPAVIIKGFKGRYS
jgi:methionyl-tRNA formyltransferase